MYLLTNEIYITYQTGFSFGRLGQAQGWDLGYRGGLGVKKKFFPKFNQILCVSYSHEWHMHRHNFLGPPPWGLGKGQLPLDFFESVGICDGAPSNVF